MRCCIKCPPVKTVLGCRRVTPRKSLHILFRFFQILRPREVFRSEAVSLLLAQLLFLKMFTGTIEDKITVRTTRPTSSNTNKRKAVLV